MGIGGKLKMKINKAIKANNFLLKSKEVYSFKAGGCSVPIKKTISRINKIQFPKFARVKANNANIVAKLAYLWFSLKTALATCPPSSCPAGSKLMAVTNNPTHPANAVG